jgi:hypothetical protein
MVVVGVVFGALVAAPATAAGGSRLLFRLSDSRIDEASGVGVGIRSPGALYVQNDSGDSARFFALDAHSGRTLAVYHVPGATNVDWEDLAVAPDARGVPSVWLADIGDNDAVRRQIAIYRVDEPRVPGAPTGQTIATAAPQVWRLRYPSGPVNAESLAVSPTGAAYIFTKSLSGSTRVYAVPTSSRGGRVQLLQAIGSITFSVTGTPNPFSIVGNLTATGAALSRSGRLLVVRTYSDAYFWPVLDGNVAAAIRTTPVRIALPEQPQGEGIAFDGSRVVLDSEHAGSAVYSVAVPAALAGGGLGASSSSAPASSNPLDPSSDPTSSPNPANSPSPHPSSSTAPSRTPTIESRSVEGLVLLLVAAGVWTLLRRRRPPRPPGLE